MSASGHAGRVSPGWLHRDCFRARASVALLLPVLALPAPARAEDVARPESAGGARRSAVVEVVERVAGAVVALEIWREDGAPAPGADPKQEGSGVLIDSRGFIITNHHVVERARVLRAVLSDGSSYKAEPVAVSEESELAVLRIPAVGREFPAIPMGKSDDLMPGETVIAIGSPYGLQHTVSVGVVSAVRRKIQLPNGGDFDDFIQTDAAINPGNSGGALVNIEGDLIGINTAVFHQGWGLAFAIPVDRIRRLLEEYVDEEHRIGLRVEPSANGLRVTEVSAEERPANAEILPGDVLVRADGKPLRTTFDLVLARLGGGRGLPIELEVVRNGELLTVALEPVSAEERRGEDLWRALGIRVSPAAVRGRHGVKREGLVVEDVRSASPAALIEIRRGDLVEKLTLAGPDGRARSFDLRSRGDLVNALGAFPGAIFRVALLRDGRSFEGEIRAEPP